MTLVINGVEMTMGAAVDLKLVLKAENDEGASLELVVHVTDPLDDKWVNMKYVDPSGAVHRQDFKETKMRPVGRE